MIDQWTIEVRSWNDRIMATHECGVCIYEGVRQPSGRILCYVFETGECDFEVVIRATFADSKFDGLNVFISERDYAVMKLAIP